MFPQGVNIGVFCILSLRVATDVVCIPTGLHDTVDIDGDQKA